MTEFSWVGSQEHFIDNPNIGTLASMVIGRFGGSSSAGQDKNEDGCLVWLNENHDWEFVILLDAHNTAESAELIVKEFTSRKDIFHNILSQPVKVCFRNIEEAVIGTFKGKDFLETCKQVTGETACLIVCRKGKYLWWFSVGDNSLYLFHPELIALGQYQVNQRHFYEWIGRVNTFEQPVPCYSSGTKELRKGLNHLFLTTDGLIECPCEPYKDPYEIYKVLVDSPEAVKTLFETIQLNNVRDSTTIVAWSVNVTKEATLPSNRLDSL